jgi:LDH2 family malate/lactate/ureidoglycolate dehydrogenase
MPNVSAERLTDIANALLQAAGASAEEATTIARYNIGANLVGHDSHGIILIPTYIDRIKAGHISFRARRGPSFRRPVPAQ